MTWKEVKDKIESAGVTDSMNMWYIDISFDDKLFVYPQSESGDNSDNAIGFSVSN